MPIEIIFPRPEALNLGRSGYSYAEGVHLSARQDCIALQPINSAGNLSAARIVVPKSHLGALRDAIDQLLADQAGKPTQTEEPTS